MKKMKKKDFYRMSFLSLAFFTIIILGWSAYDKLNPIYTYLFVYPVQYIRASLEAERLEPVWKFITETAGDCRIQNTVAVIKDPTLFVVFGKIYDPETQIQGYHQWAAIDEKNPADYSKIVDNTTGLSEEVKKRASYIPFVVYRLDDNSCTLTKVRTVKHDLSNDEEKFIIKIGEIYVRFFCKKYKEIYE